MEEKNRPSILKYAITFVVCAVLVLVYLLIFGLFDSTDPKEIATILVNGFFSVGIICVCFGGLMIVANAGAFDFISYGIGRFFSLFKKNPNDVKYKTFYDYRVAKAEKGKSESMFYMIAVGLFYVIVSIILLFALYY